MYIELLGYFLVFFFHIGFLERVLFGPLLDYGLIFRTLNLSPDPTKLRSFDPV